MRKGGIEVNERKGETILGLHKEKEMKKKGNESKNLGIIDRVISRHCNP